MAVLVTGWSGTGKSTLARTFEQQHIEAIDTDRVDGLCGWVDKRTGSWHGRTCPEPFSEGNFDWNWKEATLESLLKEHPDAILCGSANNAERFFSLFTHIFVLGLPEQEQRRRMNARTEHNFGQNPATQDRVIAGQAELIETARRAGAIIIDAQPSSEVVAANILRHIHDAH